MPKIIKWLIIILAILALLGSAAAFYIYGYYLPYQNAANTMPDKAAMELYQQEDGSVLVTWPEGVGGDRYLLEILRYPAQTAVAETTPDGETVPVQPEVLYSTYIMEGTSHVLTNLPTDEEVAIRVSTATPYTYPFEEEPRLRPGEKALEIRGVFTPPTISDLQWTADPEAKQVAVTFSMPINSEARIFHIEDGQPVLQDSMRSGKCTLTFGPNGTYPVPSYDGSHTFCFDLIRYFDSYTYHGIITESFSVVREDLLGTVLELVTTELGNNKFQFSWNETKGEYYEFQQYNASKKTWTTLATVPQDGERVYTTGHLSRYSEFTYRVVALGGQTLPDSEFSATPAKSTVITGASVVYSTIWPIQKLDIYSDVERTEVVGSAPAARAYCVLDLQDGMFLIRYGKDAYGYIDSNYCLINLPDMIGNICLYDIKNSYASIYMAHEYELPQITNTIITGYEHIQLSEGNYLVPLLYPTARKLEIAAFAAIDSGYKLKIYDSFRPQKATRMLFDTTKGYLADPIPEEQFTDKVLTDMPVLEEGEVLTYQMLITDNGRYDLSYFLAASGSRHNQGLALDLTIVNIYTGKEMQMQSSIHDLTWYAERKRNNKDANLLSRFMTDAGFGTLVSEWWHYQDNDAKDTLKPAFLWEGVNPNCWIKDDIGWRYRLEDGRRYYNCTRTINGVSYTFDRSGYVIDENGQRVDSV